MHRLASRAVLLAYLAGATASGLPLSGRRPPLDEVALPAAYRWARPVASPVAPTTQPVTEFELRFRGRPPRSDLGGLSTWDDQFFVVFREGAVRPRSGQTSVHIEVHRCDLDVDAGLAGPRPDRALAEDHEELVVPGRKAAQVRSRWAAAEPQLELGHRLGGRRDGTGDRPSPAIRGRKRHLIEGRASA